MESEDPNETPQDPKDTNKSVEKNTPKCTRKQNTSDSNETTTNSQNENESSKKDDAKNPPDDSQTNIQTPENPRSVNQSRLLSEGKSVGDISW